MNRPCYRNLFQIMQLNNFLGSESQTLFLSRLEALYIGTIQPYAGRNLKLTRLSAIISPYLATFIKHSKSNTAFLREMVIIFSPFYLLETTYVISSFNLNTNFKKINARCNDDSTAIGKNNKYLLVFCLQNNFFMVF